MKNCAKGDGTYEGNRAAQAQAAAGKIDMTAVAVAEFDPDAECANPGCSNSARVGSRLCSPCIRFEGLATPPRERVLRN